MSVNCWRWQALYIKNFVASVTSQCVSGKYSMASWTNSLNGEKKTYSSLTPRKVAVFFSQEREGCFWIPVSNSMKVTKVTFIPHIKYLKAKCVKTMNLLKILSRTTWGSDRNCLLNLYKSLVQSRLDYGAVLYHSATPSALWMRDPVYHLQNKPYSKSLRGIE